MMGMHSRTVTVSRSKLIEALKRNLAIHRMEYEQALVDFKERLVADLKAATKRVNAADPEDLKDFNVQIRYPQNHEKDFQQILDMMELSVDENITLDQDSFRAYFKNEWTWTDTFKLLNSSYKIGGSMLK